LQTENTISNLPENDEITLKELILKIKEYGREILRKWWVLLIFMGISCAYFLYKYKKDRSTYTADLTFVINTDGGVSMGLGAILGGSLTGGGGNNKLEKVIEFSRSRRIIQTALFKPLIINGDTDLIANHLIRDAELHKVWKKDTNGLKDFIYNKAEWERLSNPANFSRLENRVLLALYKIMVGKTPIFAASYEKKSEIMKLVLTTHNEDLSIELLRVLYGDLSAYYKLQTTAKEEKTYGVLKKQVDSVKAVLDAKEMAAAREEDASRGSFLLEDKAKIERMKKDGMISNAIYGEAMKNLTMAGLAKENAQPFIKDLDLPIGPIKPEKLSLLKSLAMGLGLGFFLGSILVIIRKVFMDALA
jgi:hypothetical protein